MNFTYWLARLNVHSSSRPEVLPLWVVMVHVVSVWLAIRTRERKASHTCSARRSVSLVLLVVILSTLSRNEQCVAVSALVNGAPDDIEFKVIAALIHQRRGDCMKRRGSVP